MQYLLQNVIHFVRFAPNFIRSMHDYVQHYFVFELLEVTVDLNEANKAQGLVALCSSSDDGINGRVFSHAFQSHYMSARMRGVSNS